MFCPLCKAEYREGSTRCTQCGVELIVAQDAQPPDAGEPVAHALLWSGMDPVLAEEICETLSEAGIPFFRPQRPNVEASLFSPVPLGFDVMKHEILVPEELLTKAKDLLDIIPKSAPVLFCPLCNAQHFAEMQACTDCGLPLVKSPMEIWKDPPVLLWCGLGVRKEKRLLNSLRDAQLRTLTLDLSNASGGLGHAAAVIVQRRDVANAQELLVAALDEPDLGMEAVVKMLGLEGCVVDGYFPAGGIAVEVWAGETMPDGTSAFDFFAGTGLVYTVMGQWMWFVPPEEEDRAHELILGISGAASFEEAVER